VQGAGEPNFGIRRAAPPRALVLTGYGINCDYETTHACELAGFRADRVHLNDMIGGLRRLFDFKLLVFPGGFSYGDDLGSGVAFSSKIRLNEDGRLFDALMEYVQRGGLVLGVCNGFQILVRLGIIPALGDRYGEQQVTMAPNQQGYFIDRWVNLIVEPGNGSVFTRGLKRLRLPVRHGEGRLLVPEEGLLRQLEENRRVVLRYCDGDGRPSQEFPHNPNGSLNSIAGICDSTGRVFGLMPHPEAALNLYRYPDWMRMRERARRAGKELSEKGDGCSIFEGAFSSLT
jgi:phosphoribosylformylglycinamidine synthase I